MNRREKIEAMLRDEPGDMFLRYALAMEMEKEGELESALAIHWELTQAAQPNIASFFRSAQIHAGQGRLEPARGFLREGIEAARNAGDLHSAGEMSEMLTQIGQMGE